MPGTIAVPHGWGHKGTGGWRLANRAGGVNVNQLMSSDPEHVEALAGMSWLTGVPVRVEPDLITLTAKLYSGRSLHFRCWNTGSARSS